MKLSSGALLLATGALHQVVLLVLGSPVLMSLLERGYVGQAEADPLEMAAFWSLGFGFLLMMLGGLAHGVERAGVRLPGWLGWALILVGLVGGLGMPVSGFWLVVPQGWWIIRKAGERSPVVKPRAPARA